MKTTELKYELFKESPNHILYRIRALRDIPRHNVKAGDIGGYVEKEENLSQVGHGWIDSTSRVIGDGFVGEGFIGEQSVVRDESRLESGYIYNSSLKRDSVITGFVTINNSNILGSTLSGGGKVLNSTVENAEIMGFAFLKEVKLKVFKKLLIGGSMHWENVKMTIGDIGRIDSTSSMKDVVLYAKELDITQRFQMEYASIKCNELFCIEKMVRPTYVYEISGEEDSYLIHGGERLMLSASSLEGGMSLNGNFHFMQSRIEGTPSLTGTISMDSCKVEGCVSIEAEQLTMIDCQLSDFAQLRQSNPTGIAGYIEYVTLKDDDLFVVTDS